MRLNKLKKAVIRRIQNTDVYIDIPNRVNQYIINEDYHNLMKYFKTFCFIHPNRKCRSKKQSNDSNHILKYKYGKCGALTQLCYHMLKQCNKQVFFVAANFDHAWCLVWSHKSNKYISLDPSDGLVNKWRYQTQDMRLRKIYIIDHNLVIDISHIYTLYNK